MDLVWPTSLRLALRTVQIFNGFSCGYDKMTTYVKFFTWELSASNCLHGVCFYSSGLLGRE